MVDDLTEGSEYTFRVAASNKYGKGEFAESKIVVPKSPFGKKLEKDVCTLFGLYAPTEVSRNLSPRLI